MNYSFAMDNFNLILHKMHANLMIYSPAIVNFTKIEIVNLIMFANYFTKINIDYLILLVIDYFIKVVNFTVMYIDYLIMVINLNYSFKLFNCFMFKFKMGVTH